MSGRLDYSFAPVPEQLAAAVVAGDLPDAAITMWVLVNRATKGVNTFRGSWAELAATIGWTRDKTQRVGLAMEAAGWATGVRSSGQAGVFLLHTTPGPIVPDHAAGADPEPVADFQQVKPEPVADLPQDPPQISHDPVGNFPRVGAADLHVHAPLEVESGENYSKPAGAADEVTGEQGQATPAASPPLVIRVGQALAEAGMPVALVRKAEQVGTVEQLVNTHGVEALVRHARAQFRPDRPPVSMAAFIRGWEALPPPRPKPPAAAVQLRNPQAVAAEERSPEATRAWQQARAALRRGSTAAAG